MNRAFLLLGGNLGDREDNLAAAASLLHAQVGPVANRSAMYETEAWGGVNQPDYLNQALEIQTEHSAESLLSSCLRIEEQLGRIRQDRWESRLIDIDILFYNTLIINTSELTLPHPRLHTRRFALTPMVELAPEFRHPILNLSMQELLEQCDDPLWARPFIHPLPVDAKHRYLP